MFLKSSRNCPVLELYSPVLETLHVLLLNFTVLEKFKNVLFLKSSKTFCSWVVQEHTYFPILYVSVETQKIRTRILRNIRSRYHVKKKNQIHDPLCLTATYQFGSPIQLTIGSPIQLLTIGSPIQLLTVILLLTSQIVHQLDPGLLNTISY